MWLAFAQFPEPLSPQLTQKSGPGYFSPSTIRQILFRFIGMKLINQRSKHTILSSEYWRATMLFKISTTYTLWSAQHRFLLAFDQFVNRSFINFFAYRRYLTQKCVLVARSRLKVLFRSLDYTQQIKEQEKNRSTNCCSRACQWL